MSKKKGRTRVSSHSSSVNTTKKTPRRRFNLGVAAPLLILVLGAIAFGGFLNNYSPVMGLRSTESWTTTVEPLPTPDYAASNPAKEYVYGGGKLIAVSEPEVPAPTDLAVWRKSTGTWWVLDQDGSNTTQAFGLDGDIPAPGDYDGDQKTDFCIYRPSEGKWYYLLSGSNNTFVVLPFGNNGDLPAPADYNGDGKTEIALFRPTNNTWYLQDTTLGYLGSWAFGAAGDKPVPSDYDGDGKADMAVWRDGTATWWVQHSTDGSWTSQAWGASGDRPVPGDYDGDGKTDYAVWKSNNEWYIQKSSAPTTSITTTWGIQATDIAVQGDYDADGKTDIACWRGSNGTWYIIESTRGQRVQPWGMDGDIPVPAPYRR